MKKILVVEDNSQHMRDALQILSNIEGLEIITATSLSEAGKKIYHENPEGVITDIFLPYNDGELAENPLGLNVAAMAASEGIKSVFCTDSYHHGEKMEWIYDLFCNLRGPLDRIWGSMMIDINPNFPNDGKKKWVAAYEHLIGKTRG